MTLDVIYIKSETDSVPLINKKEEKMSPKILDNDTFVRENFEEIVEKYAHQTIVICRGEIFTGEDAVKKALKKYPKTIPLWFRVPGPENFLHVL